MNNTSGEHHPYYNDYTDTPDPHLVEGFDPEVALDLGIAIDHDSLETQKASARQVSELLDQQPDDIQALTDAAEHAALDAKYGSVLCANCNKPGCKGCGRS